MILDYRDYVLSKDLAKAKGVTSAAVNVKASYTKIRRGAVCFIKKDSIPEKEKHLINKCADLTDYTTLADFKKLTSMQESRFATLQYYRRKKGLELVPHLKLYNCVFIKMTEEIKQLHEEGAVFCVLNQHETVESAIKEGFDGIVLWHHLKLGFYK